MIDINRRKLLKTSGTALGLSAIPGAAAATGNSQKDDQRGLAINEKTVLINDNNKTVYALDITNNQEQSSRQRFLTTVNKENGKVTLSEVGAQQFNKLTSTNDSKISSNDSRVKASKVDGGGMRVATNEVTITADTPIIERSDTYEHDDGSCAVYDHTHLWAAVTAEFANEVGDLSWAAIGAALISLIGSSALSAGASAVLVAGVTVVGGIAAYLTNTYAITFGVEEWDATLAGYDQALYSTKVAGGYHKSDGELTTIDINSGHPSQG